MPYDDLVVRTPLTNGFLRPYFLSLTPPRNNLVAFRTVRIRVEDRRIRPIRHKKDMESCILPMNSGKCVCGWRSMVWCSAPGVESSRDQRKHTSRDPEHQHPVPNLKPCCPILAAERSSFQERQARRPCPARHLPRNRNQALSKSERPSSATPPSRRAKPAEHCPWRLSLSLGGSVDEPGQ